MGTSSLGIDQCVPSKSTPTDKKFYKRDRKTGYFHGFPFLVMLQNLMGNHGKERLKLLRVVSPVRTSALRGKEKVLKGQKAGFGKKWPGSFAKLNHTTCFWKTRQPCLIEGLGKSLAIWPSWGIMQDGECFVLPILARIIKGKGYGCLPTPLKIDGRLQSYKKNSFIRNHSIASLTEYFARQGRCMIPETVEILMRWPEHWTDLKPLEMGRFQEWLRLHGVSYPETSDNSEA